MERKITATTDLSVDKGLSFECIGAENDTVLPGSGPDSVWSRTLANSSTGSQTRNASETSLYKTSSNKKPQTTTEHDNAPHRDQQHARKQSAEVDANRLSRLMFQWASELLWVSLEETAIS